mmetsp:Transcript_43976/g.72700  ORF Transcript_43976/g.72700 Transcript_43976/m.72700 type:complete len:211 (+) Transcript_43976:240-872(+)
MVKFRRQLNQQLAQKQRMLAQIKINRAIKHFSVAHAHNNAFKLFVIPARRRMLNHSVGRVIILVIVRIQKHRLLPVQIVLARLQQRRNIESRPKQIDMLHQLNLLVLGVQDTQLRINALMRTIQIDTLLEQIDELGKMTANLIVSNQVVQMVHKHDDIETANLRQSKLVRIHTRVTHILPRLNRVGFTCRIHRLLILLQTHQTGRQFGII